MTTEQICEYATIKSEELSFTEFIEHDEVFIHFKNEARKFLLNSFGDAAVGFIGDSPLIDDSAKTKMAIFWLQAHNLIELKEV